MKLAFNALSSMALFMLVACGAPSLQGLPAEYVKTMRDLGYVAVFPAREDFNVGDVYLRATRSEDLFDPSQSVREKVGVIPELRRLAGQKLSERTAMAATSLDANGRISLNQSDAIQSGAGNRLPALAFPSVVAASSAAAGGGAHGISFGGGSREQVILSFGPVRRMSSEAFALDRALNSDMQGPGNPALRALGELRRTFCPRLSSAFATMLVNNGVDCAEPNRQCTFVVVTDTYVTREISYTYRDADAVEAAFAKSADATPTIEITIPEGQSREEFAAAILQSGALSSTAPTPGAAAAFSRGRGYTFVESFPAPVAIAFEGIFVPVAPLCSGASPSILGE